MPGPWPTRDGTQWTRVGLKPTPGELGEEVRWEGDADPQRYGRLSSLSRCVWRGWKVWTSRIKPKCGGPASLTPPSCDAGESLAKTPRRRPHRCSFRLHTGWWARSPAAGPSRAGVFAFPSVAGSSPLPSTVRAAAERVLSRTTRASLVVGCCVRRRGAPANTKKNQEQSPCVSLRYTRRPEGGRRRRARSLSLPAAAAHPPPSSFPPPFPPHATRRPPLPSRQTQRPATWAAPSPPPAPACRPCASTSPRRPPPRRRSSATAASPPPRPRTRATSSTR